MLYDLHLLWPSRCLRVESRVQIEEFYFVDSDIDPILKAPVYCRALTPSPVFETGAGIVELFDAINSEGTFDTVNDEISPVAEPSKLRQCIEIEHQWRHDISEIFFSSFRPIDERISATFC